MIGRAVAIKLSGNVADLPGTKVDQHVTVLFSTTGVTEADRLLAEKEYANWQAATGKRASLPFYLKYWTGGRSELIEGELKDLVEFIRSAAPKNKVPQPPREKIHVELY
ncbi:MAG TPA: hypothetical protein VEL47_03415 [Myxococcota bacterium]|nr:hypothetical protein [Myxococcota bacterium]